MEDNSATSFSYQSIGIMQILNVLFYELIRDTPGRISRFIVSKGTLGMNLCIDFMKHQIRPRVSAAQAILAQSNQMPQGVL